MNHYRGFPARRDTPLTLFLVCSLYCLLVIAFGMKAVSLGVDEVQYIARGWLIITGGFELGSENLHYPPGWYWALGFWQKFFGRELQIIRLLPMILGLGTILMTYFLCRDLVGSKAGVLGTILLAINPLFINLHSNSKTQPLVLLLFSAVLWLSVSGREMRWPVQAFLIAFGISLMLLVRGHMIVSLPVFLILIWWFRDRYSVVTPLVVIAVVALITGLVFSVLPDRTVLDIVRDLNVEYYLNKLGMVDLSPVESLRPGESWLSANSLMRRLPAQKTYFADLWYYKWLVVELFRHPLALTFLVSPIVAALGGLFLIFKKPKTKPEVGALFAVIGYFYLAAGHFLAGLFAGGVSLILPLSMYFHTAQIPMIATLFLKIRDLRGSFHSHWLTISLAIFWFALIAPGFLTISENQGALGRAQKQIAELTDQFREYKKQDEEILYIGFNRAHLLALSLAGVDVNQKSFMPRYVKLVDDQRFTSDPDLYQETERRGWWSNAHLSKWIGETYDTVLISTSAYERHVNQNIKGYGKVFPQWAFDEVREKFSCDPLELSQQESLLWCKRRGAG